MLPDSVTERSRAACSQGTSNARSVASSHRGQIQTTAPDTIADMSRWKRQASPADLSLGDAHKRAEHRIDIPVRAIELFTDDVRETQQLVIAPASRRHGGTDIAQVQALGRRFGR